MDKIVVTSGNTYTDIDALACAIAYGEILNKSNRPSEVYLPGPLNQSVVPEIKAWGLNYSTHLDVHDRPLVVVDVSEPDYLKNSLNLSKVVEIYDHHFGFEIYWQDILGENSHIEPIGACATLIWEQAIKHDVVLSTTSLNLLYTTIFSHTLNFNSSVTKDRDKQAFSEMSHQTNLPQNWVSRYFQQLESESLSDPISAIKNDIKVAESPLFSQSIFIGQLELWQGNDFILKNKDIIKSTLIKKNSPYWFFTCPSISEGKNYIYTENLEIKNFLTTAVNAVFVNNIGTTPKLYLRKEILKLLS